MPKVYIVNNDHSIRRMFIANGWDVWQPPDGYIGNGPPEDIDLVQFTGGEDVDPALYGEGRHPATRSNINRDGMESFVFREFVGLKPMAGICRGGQFLNVMCGGKLWQHVTGHAMSGTHEAFCRVTETPIQVTSTHHQMMIPHESGKVLMVAQVCDNKQGWNREENGFANPDVEAVLYRDKRVLCYQPHPEYTNINHECQRTYFDYLNRFIL